MYGRIRSCAARMRSRWRDMRVTTKKTQHPTFNGRALRLGRLGFSKRSEEIERDGKKGRGVMFAGNFAHGLEKTQLERDRLLAHHRGGLHHFLGGLKSAFGIDHLGAALALG